MANSEISYLLAEKSIKEQEILKECFKNRKRIIINKQGKNYTKIYKYKTNGN